MSDKKELKEIRFDATEIVLQDNLVRGSILPEKISELTRNVIINGNTEIEGAVFGNTIQVRGGDVSVKGAVFAQKELYISTEVKGSVTFMKAVGSADSITARAGGRPTFCSDLNGKSVTLQNCYVAGSIYADEISLENCVVIGGVFATQEARISNCIVGTFNASRVTLSGVVQLLLPSAFTLEPPVVESNTRLYNLALADLGALFKGVQQDELSGRIPMNLETDEVKSNLTMEDGRPRQLRSFTVIGKVLAADMIDTDRFHNHFLLTAASLGPQLLKTYDLGKGADGKTVALDTESIRDFLFDILSGKKEPKEMDGRFSLEEMAR